VSGLYDDDLEDSPVGDVLTLTTGTTHINQDNNYIYSQLGELQVDVSEEIEEIVWRVDSKIAEVRRTSGSTKKNLRFDYDPMSNRIAKHICADNAFTQWENSTYYVRDASGNVMATYNREATGQTPPSSFRVAERHLYGSSRLGIDATPYEFIATTYSASPEASRSLGQKHYEISNHLGNVLSVITDQKLPVVDVSIVVSYAAVVLSATDYSPFGVGLYGRSWSEGYRFGFNGMEKDSEGMGGGGSTYDYGFRIYNPSLAKFLSVDPLSTSYPWYTPYQFAGNAPIWAIDLDGLEQAVVVRWYNNNNQCTGQTVFVIRNSDDRPLGQHTFLFMNLPDTEANKSSINDLGFGTSATPQNIVSNALRTFLTNNTQGSNQSDLTDFQGNPVSIQTTSGGLVTGNAFTRGSLSQANQRTVDNINSSLDNSENRNEIQHPQLGPDIIYFADESATFDPTLDTGNDGTPNSQELNQAIAKLRLEPDKVGNVTGNSSIEDDPGGMSNQGISANRANTVFNLMIQNAQLSGVNLVGRVTNLGGAGSTNADPDPAQNQDGQPSTNRNATITYDIPRQNQ